MIIHNIFRHILVMGIRIKMSYVQVTSRHQYLESLPVRIKMSYVHKSSYNLFDYWLKWSQTSPQLSYIQNNSMLYVLSKRLVMFS